MSLAEPLGSAEAAEPQLKNTAIGTFCSRSAEARTARCPSFQQTNSTNRL